MIQSVLLKDIKLGMCLAEGVYAKSGKEIFQAGFYFTSFKQIEELSDYYIKDVRIDYSRSLIDESTPQEKKKNESELKVIFENPEEIYTNLVQHINEVKPIFDKSEIVVKEMMEDAKAGKQPDVKAIAKYAMQMVTDVHKNPMAALAILEKKNTQERYIVHSVNVAVMAIALAGSMHFAVDKQFSLCKGAFWHDIGKYKFNPYMNRRPTKLDEHEQKAFQMHTVFGVELLDKYGIKDDMVEEIVAYHHQNYDGTGYPKTFAGARQRRYAALISIADYYDYLIGDEPKISPSQAIAKIFTLSGTMFDPRSVNSFVKMMGIYPVGSVVELSNEMIGTVIAFSQLDLLKPIVKTMFHKKSPKTPENKIISLIDCDLQIVGPYTLDDDSSLRIFNG